jgi:glutamyl-tRNA synthetase
LTTFVERSGLKPSAVYQPLRVALAGRAVSPGIFETVAVLGRDETLSRIDEIVGKRLR